MPTKRRRKTTETRLRRWSRRLSWVVAAVIVTSVLLVLPLRWINPLTTAFMLQDDSGRDPLLHEWIEWERMSPRLALAVVAAEDQRFADHAGIDFGSIRDSIEDSADGGRLRGASTISQQLAKNLYLWPGRSLFRKAVEAWMTLVIEVCLPKRRILELYLNVVELGPGIYGVDAASRHFFGKSPVEVSVSDAALLAAVLPNPKRLHVDDPSDYVRERQEWIEVHLRRLEREAWLTRIDQGL